MLRVYFDNVLLNEDSVLKFNLRRKLFNGEFKLGSTVCTEVTLWVEKTAVTSHPSVVTIYEYDGTTESPIAYLHVDTLDDTNNYYYAYTLLDGMVNLNQYYDWSELDNPTVLNILRNIISKFGLSPTWYTIGGLYLSSMIVNWQEYTTAREFISYIAETQGGYAYIDGLNRLHFQPFQRTVVASYDGDMISDLSLGDFHSIHRVVYDNLVHYEDKIDDNGETVYLNPDNILFTDSGSFTIEGIVNHIGEVIFNSATPSSQTALEFYNLQVSTASLDQAISFIPGSRISVLNNETLLEIDYSYNGMWTGGFDLQVNTGHQEETNIVDSKLDKAINKIGVTIDRQQGQIDIYGQQITELEENNIHFQVDAAKSEVRVTNQNTYTPTAYTSFKGDGMRIYTPEDTEPVASATAQRFECHKGLGVQDWSIEQGKSPASLIIFRRE